MANLVLTLVLDSMMALLLTATIVYCWKLNFRIRLLQDSKSELAQLIRQFDDSTQRATQSISEIHEASKRISDNIQHKLDKANYLADDLQFMIEKGNKIADRLEGNVTSRPAAPRASTAPVAAASARPQRQAASAPLDEAPMPEIPASLKERPASRPAPTQPAREERAARASALESVLQRVGSKNNAEGGEASAAPQRPASRMRSKAEQELLEALKSGN